MASTPPPECLGPRAPTSPPRWKLPPGSWDTHFHVLGPQSRFPYSPSRKYTPPDAPYENLRAAHSALGVDRGLVVHANTHGFDNSVDLDTVGRSQGQYFAVVRLDASVTTEQAKRLHSAGARGVRFAFNPQHGGTLDLAVFDHVLKVTRGLDWFVELHFEGDALPSLRSWLKAIPAVVVIDHFGRIDPAKGIDHESFRVLMEVAQKENVWVKLSGTDRISRVGFPYPDVAPFAHRLLDVAADRLIWGSDWPHTGIFDATKMPEDGKLADAQLHLVPDERLRRRVLVDNPVRLLGLETRATKAAQS